MSDLMDFDYYDEESGPSDILAINSADLSNSIRFTLKGEDGKTPLPDNPQFEAFWKNKAAFDTSDTNAHGVLVYDETESATYPDGRVQWAFKDETTASKIQWKTLEDKFGKGEMEEPFGRAVGWLRSQTMWYLLRKVTAPPQQGEADRESFSVSRVCYAESGSKTVTSDLDWSFVNWKEPGKVVDIAVDWYKAFYKIYDGYPGGVFDMNMYIEPHMVKSKACYDHIGGDADAKAKRIKGLFRRHEHSLSFDLAYIRSQFKKGEITGADGLTSWWNPKLNVLWTFGRYQNKKFRRYDQYISYLLNEKKMKHQVPADPFDDQLTNFAQAKWFYEMVRQIQEGSLMDGGDNLVQTTGSHVVDDVTMLYMVIICRLTMFYANEATTTIQALAQHGTGSPPRISSFDEYDFYLSYMDWFHFIHEHYVHHTKYKTKWKTDHPLKTWGAKEDTEEFVKFWDRISKYVWRTFEAVTQTPLRDNGFFSTLATWTNTYTDFDVLLGYTGLYDFSQVWKNLIRGKFDMEKTFIKPLQARGWRMRNNPYTENLERQTPRVVPTNMKEDDRVLIMAVYAGLQNLRAKAIRFDVNSDANAAGGDPVIALYNLLNRHKKAVEKAFLQETIINTISCRAARTFYMRVEQEIADEVRDCKARWDNAIKGVEDYIKTKVATVKDPLSVTLNADVAYNNPIKQFIGDLPT
eukprot:85620_1